LKATAINFFVFDTSVLIDHLRTNRFADAVRRLEGVIRFSAVVLAELYRGARTRTEVRVINSWARRPIVLTPTSEMWLRSGRTLAWLAGQHPLDPESLRRLHFDLLIALSARSIGATVVTTDRVHFELLQGMVPFSLVVW
jgi:predicted nucleic acid-binding protein